ncbi:PPC domain-containing protein [Spirilliplanes yamanashiensis]|uniref:Peptidase C-terminal archaeal/bacterial domain-containing protein n=1 Tax=Spirilliplanes yamanashiensis TaxID=42233 RepID=A0A8J3YAB1_9ACTN|nr:pre-peptidase C-terminal domain-containing protein [Spirilliplanes yamanashiensis]MDP9817994.1 hypothetical protein [Spirilliplanes yamanashiensis]GIJ04803.1 hypothetical protein Sya03_41550 [Spirilliplanes yamanashiensis]
MRRTVATLGACLLGFVALTPAAAATAAPAGGSAPSAADAAALAAGIPVAPKAAAGAAPAGPNPFLALLPDPAKADYSGWVNRLEKQAAAEAKQRARASRAVALPPLVVDEDEPAGTWGGNDEPSAGQLVRDFGTAAGKNPKARVLGALSPQRPSPASRTPFSEDNGSITLASDLGLGGSTNGVRIPGSTIGDGPHGTAGTGTGDFDFYRIAATAGQVIVVDVDTPASDLDSIVVLYDAAGAPVARNDDVGLDRDSYLRFPVPAPGPYFLVVAGYGNLPADPYDPASGDRSGSTGLYDVTISATVDDRDFYAVKLRKGDVLGASVKGAATQLDIYDTLPRLAHGSGQDASALYPIESPLPGGGNAVTEHVAEEAGWHFVAVSAATAGSYDITVEAYRPVLEKNKPVQTLFLDFDGARVNTAVWGGPGVVQLSPFAGFLSRWGLTRLDEDAVIDAVVAAVEENVRQDLIDSGLNTRFKIKVTNSRDHADTFGKPNVSRVIIGGTVDESGVDTIGIAQTIDPGNFNTQETALVLLDYLSEPAGESYTLNTYLTPASDRIAFVGRAFGNVVSHEAGHFFGNWHVDQFNPHPDLMDQGGNFPNMFGVGPDGVGGTADDIDVDFGHDDFNPGEGFTGVENTLGRVVFGVTS